MAGGSAARPLERDDAAVPSDKNTARGESRALGRVCALPGAYAKEASHAVASAAQLGVARHQHERTAADRRQRSRLSLLRARILGKRRLHRTQRILLQQLLVQEHDRQHPADVPCQRDAWAHEGLRAGETTGTASVHGCRF